MLSLLCEIDFKENDDFRQTKSYPNLMQNNYLNILKKIQIFNEFVTFSKQIFSQSSDNDQLMGELKSFVGSKIDSLGLNEAISMGISCLQSFAYINWLGPVPIQFSTLTSEIKKLDLENPSESLTVLNLINHFDLNSEEFEKYQETCRALLNLDGETLFQTVKCSHLLLLSKLIFLDHYEKITDKSKLSCWWSLRLIFLYQQLFEEKSSTLKEMFEKILLKMNEFFDLQSDICLLKTHSEKIFKVATIVFNLEAGHLYYQSYNWTMGQECFKKAIQLAYLDIELVGVFVKNDENLDFRNLNYLNKDLNLSELPKDFALNDDTVLNKIKISNPEQEKELEESRGIISQLEQVVLFCSMFDFY
ncbi:tetratricopeptide repeat 27, partial [Brachionus plicatilis]